MQGERNAPFTNFVLALAHSGDTFAAFTEKLSDEEIASQWGIEPDQVRAVREGNLEEIQKYIANEVGGQPVASIWIGKLPWPWIGTS
jgi:hypothetical protein